MALDRNALQDVTTRTLAYYAGRAEAFREGTRDHDVSQNIAALLDRIEADPPFAILDFGCGPGRDLATFSRLGHRPTGLDAVPEFVAMARAAQRLLKSGSRIFSRSTCRRRASTAYSPMRRCSMCRRRSCRACSANCARR